MLKPTARAQELFTLAFRTKGGAVPPAGTEDLLVDLSGASDLKVAVSGCGWLPPGIRFDNGKNRHANRWVFRDMVPVGLALLAPGRWVGGVDGVPVNIVQRLEVIDRRVSQVDGFAKYLFRSPLGGEFETVRIPLLEPRWSVCVSRRMCASTAVSRKAAKSRHIMIR